VCDTLDGEDRGMTGAFPLAPLRPQSTAVFTKSAVVGLGPLPLGAWMFTVEERRARNREAQRRYRAADPERYREAVRRYVAAHPERVRQTKMEADRRYREGHREGRREQNRRWYKAHEEQIREQQKRYRKSHPEQSRAWKSCHRARKRNAGGMYAAADVAIMLGNQQGRCWWCRQPMRGKHTVDHRIALARGGDNDPSNLVLCCARCNSKKQTKTPQEFAGRLL